MMVQKYHSEYLISGTCTFDIAVFGAVIVTEAVDGLGNCHPEDMLEVSECPDHDSLEDIIGTCRTIYDRYAEAFWRSPEHQNAGDR